jgi:queuine tRNA-ribosyltransferase
MLLPEINIAYYESLMKDMRSAIEGRRLADFIAATKEGWAAGEGRAPAQDLSQDM